MIIHGSEQREIKRTEVDVGMLYPAAAHISRAPSLLAPTEN